jgi:hypothetical protein
MKLFVVVLCYLAHRTGRRRLSLQIRVVVWILRKPDTDPPHMLADAFRHSIFGSGLQLRNVRNPLLREAQSAGTSK